MKKCLLLFTFFYCNFAIAQLKEGFNDGNVTSAPAWTGDLTGFQVNSSGRLQSVKSDTAGSRYLSTAVSLPAECSWEFSLELGFSATSSNFVRIYLVSDQANFQSPLNGYFVRIGENGTKDSYELFRQAGKTAELVIKGLVGRAAGSSVHTRILVNRKADGTWQLYSKNRAEPAFTLEGETKEEATQASSYWFGFQCVYTKSHAAQFYFDDIEIGGLKDPDLAPGHGAPADSSATPGNDGTPLATAIGKEEIIINELLFNPRGSGADFVEIYNRSQKIFNLKGLSVATMKRDSLSSLKRISGVDVYLYPESYMALSTDVANIKSEYDTPDEDALLQVQALPAFSNDKGVVVLVADSMVIDRFDYSESMHTPLIKEADGVSLERSSFDRPANEPGNFCSAAGSAGYATPGYRNSQLREAVPTTEAITLASKTFSPDGDGFEDQLVIHYTNTEPGILANVAAYNRNGTLTRNICRNVTLGTAGELTWDGADENGRKAPVGVYIIFVELTGLNGKTTRYRKACVLAARF